MALPVLSGIPKKLQLGALAAIGSDASASEVTYLRGALSQPSGMAFLYSTLGTVTVSSGLVDAVADRLRLGPDLVATATARPAWDADLRLITGDGINDRLSPAANHAVFDFATLRTYVTIGVFNDALNLDLAAVTESLSAVRLSEQYNGATNILVHTSDNANRDTSVAKSTSRRIVLASHNGSTSSTLRVLNHTGVTQAITALGAGTNRLTIFDYFPAGGANATGPWRATLGLTFEPTAGDLTVLATWGTTYHGAALAA